MKNEQTKRNEKGKKQKTKTKFVFNLEFFY